MTAPDAAPRADAEGVTWVRHVKRGTEHEVLGQAQMQAVEPVPDDAMVTVYRGRDGALWVRPTDEFRDGRFEPCPAPTPDPAALHDAVVAAARDWRHAGGVLDSDEIEALVRAVNAYEAALPGGRG